MSEDLHNIDEFFKAAYKQFSEDPSPEVWEKLNAGLDKKDAVAYKIKSKRWKQVAIVSLLLLSGFILKETNILKTGFGHSNKNTATVVNQKESKENAELNNANKGHQSSLPGESNIEEQTINNQVAEGTKINSNALVSLDHPNALQGEINKTAGSTNNIIQEEREYDQKQTLAILSPDNSEKNLTRSNVSSLTDEIITPSLEGKYPNGISAGQLNYVPTLHLISDFNPPSKNKSKDVNPLEDQGKWFISGFASSDRAGYRLDRDQPTITKIKEHEDHLPSFSAGVLLTRQVNKRFGLQTGLIYSDIAIIISPQKIYASQNEMGKVLYKYVTSSGNAFIKPGFASSPNTGDSLKAENAQHNLQYIITPLVAKYKLINGKKITLSPGLGIAGNFLTSAKIETEVEGVGNREHVVINKLEGIKTFNWSLMADASLDYLVNKKISLNLRPFFSYALSPISSTDYVETFPYSFGVGLGATYRF
jgi:hypothetical protein